MLFKKLALLFVLLTSTYCFGIEDLEILISPEEISQKMKELASRIDAEYRGESLTILMVMKGAVCTTADLIRNLKTPTVLEYIKASSYGKKGTDRGELQINGLAELDLASKNVLIVDDIFDSGNTMLQIVERVQKMQPKSVKTFVTLLKKVPRQITYRPDFFLFECENRFVIGYGLDYKEYYRNLPGIYSFINDTPPFGVPEI